MRTILVGLVLLMSIAASVGATNDLSATLQTGLFEEEANHDLPSAIKAYSAVAEQFDKDRKLAATAIFRLGECYRKQGATNDAVAQYQRVLRDFSDQSTLVTLSRQSLDSLGSPAKATPGPGGVSAAALAEQTQLLQQEISLLENKLASQQKQVETGVLSSGELVPTQRDLLELKRQLAALQAGQTAANPAESEPDEVRRIRELIANSPDLINAPDKDGFTLLQTAAAKGKLSVVSLLLQSGAAVDGLKAQDLTPLHYAAGNGHKAVVDLLLMKGARVDAQTESGVTPLHLAALKGYEVVARALLDAGAPVNAKVNKDVSRGEALLSYDFSEGQTPLHAAAKGGYAGVAKLLLAHGAEVNTEDGKGRTALSYAGMQHSLLMAQALLEQHADPNAGSRDLPLSHAAFSGDLPLLRLLLSKGADPNRMTFGNFPGFGGSYSPLYLAVGQHHADAVRELIKFKADPNGVPLNGLLFRALPDESTVGALIEGGADVNGANENGETPLHSAASWNPPIEQVVKLLLQKGANVNAQQHSGQTPLRYAVAGGKKDIVELLLAAGANPNLQDTSGNTPLHIAVAQGNEEIVKLLLASEANPNLRDSRGYTCLHLAVEYHQPAILELLLAKGGDPNARNNNDLTPLDLAKNQGQPGVPPGLAYQWGPGSPPPVPSLPVII